MIPNLWMRIYVLIPKLSSDSVAFIYSSSASVSLSLSLLRHIDPLRSGPPDENLLIYCKPVRLYNILRIRSLFNVNQLPIVSSLMLELQNLSKGQKKSGSAGIVVFNYKDCEVVTDGEKSKTGKKGAKAPWAKPLSRYSQMMLNHQKLTQPRITSRSLKSSSKLRLLDYLKITEEQLKASSPGKSQTDDQIQTQEPAVQSQPEVTSRETMAASPPRQD
ncbi:hypothetical protein F2Q68_00015881 [Brassica cretica]|uniref:Uncharacterized protein n=1 Tax=Brassica cretica TaxID=69181 RepID=A0A8S9HP49_BRACR|nr:hypothetical protein F2Q68_00015881 [Brassica cretica]